MAASKEIFGDESSTSDSSEESSSEEEAQKQEVGVSDVWWALF